MSEIIKIEGMSNREFLESYSWPGRIGLAGGSTTIDKAIARAQRHVDANKDWSQWSHAFVFQGQRADGHHWVIESDLQIDRRHIRLGVQENRISKFFDDGYYTNLTVLDFGLTPEQVSRVVTEGLELVANRVKYSLRELLGTLIALRHSKLRTKDNLLDRDKSFYCSAFVHHLFRTAQIDLAPGLTEKNTTPEDIWRTAVPHTCYVLDRPVLQSKLRKLRQSVKKRLPRRRTK